MEMTHKTDLKSVEQPDADQKVVNEFTGKLEAKQAVAFEKRVVVVTSRDYDDEATLKAGMQVLTNKVSDEPYQKLVEDQSQAWAKRWEKADVQITGDDAAQQGIRFNLFQLFSTFYGEDKRLNIGPKGFTGEKYGGATYWDTEGFAIPLYLSLADKKVSENLLEYRYNQLAGAFHNAREQGLKGALYPMVTFNGIEIIMNGKSHLKKFIETARLPMLFIITRAIPVMKHT